MIHQTWARPGIELACQRLAAQRAVTELGPRPLQAVVLKLVYLDLNFVRNIFIIQLINFC